eukprot:g1583.t1
MAFLRKGRRKRPKSAAPRRSTNRKEIHDISEESKALEEEENRKIRRPKSAAPRRPNVDTKIVDSQTNVTKKRRPQSAATRRPGDAYRQAIVEATNARMSKNNVKKPPRRPHSALPRSTTTMKAQSRKTKVKVVKKRPISAKPRGGSPKNNINNNNEVEVLRDEIAQLKMENTNLKDELTKSNSKRRWLEGEVRRGDQQIEEAVAQAANSSDTSPMLQTVIQLRRLRTRLHTLEDKLAVSKARVSELERGQKYTRVMELELVTEEYYQEILRLRQAVSKQIQAKANQKAQAQAAIEASYRVVSEVRQLQQEKEDLLVKLKASRAETKQAENRILDVDGKDLSVKVREQDETIIRLNQDIVKLRGDVRRLRGYLKTVKKDDDTNENQKNPAPQKRARGRQDQNPVVLRQEKRDAERRKRIDAIMKKREKEREARMQLGRKKRFEMEARWRAAEEKKKIRAERVAEEKKKEELELSRLRKERLAELKRQEALWKKRSDEAYDLAQSRGEGNKMKRGGGKRVGVESEKLSRKKKVQARKWAKRQLKEKETSDFTKATSKKFNRQPGSNLKLISTSHSGNGKRQKERVLSESDGVAGGMEEQRQREKVEAAKAAKIRMIREEEEAIERERRKKEMEEEARKQKIREEEERIESEKRRKAEEKEKKRKEEENAKRKKREEREAARKRKEKEEREAVRKRKEEEEREAARKRKEEEEREAARKRKEEEEREAARKKRLAEERELATTKKSVSPSAKWKERDAEAARVAAEAEQLAAQVTSNSMSQVDAEDEEIFKRVLEEKRKKEAADAEREKQQLEEAEAIFQRELKKKQSQQPKEDNYDDEFEESDQENFEEDDDDDFESDFEDDDFESDN